MKKLITLIAALCMTVAVIGCGDGKTAKTEAKTDAKTEAKTDAAGGAETGGGEEGGGEEGGGEEAK